MTQKLKLIIEISLKIFLFLVYCLEIISASWPVFLFSQKFFFENFVSIRFFVLITSIKNVKKIDY